MGRNVHRSTIDDIDYNKASLPKFAIWAGYNATAATAPSTYGMVAYDSDFSFISGTLSTNFAAMATGAGATAGVAMKTNTALGSGGLVGSDGWAKGTPTAGYDGHTYISAAIDGSYAFRARVLTNVNLPYFGVTIGDEGFRASFTPAQRGNTMQVFQYASGLPMPLDTFVLDGTVMTLFSLTAGSLGTNGAIGYNRRTNTLVVLEAKDTAMQSMRAHIWRNPRVKLSGRMAQLSAFIKGAAAAANPGQSYRYVDFAWTTTAPSATNTEHTRYRVFPCNNGAIAMTRMVISTGHDLGIIAPDNTFAQRSGGVVSTGTTYGAGDAVDYGCRHNITWDNKWGLSYSPYTGYGCGMIGYLVNLDDPTINYNVNVPVTTDGIQAVPFSRSGFLLNDSSNSGQSQGPSVAILDASQGQTTLGINLVNQTAYTLNFIKGVMDNPTTQVNFALMLPVERWAAPGVINGNL